MAKIDSEGTFLGTIQESGVNVTSKSQFPQWVGRLLATQKFVADAEGMAHFGLTEPGYVDWSSFEEDAVAYLVLFNSAEDFSDQTKMLNYEQLQLATGWDGASFDALADGSLIGKTVMFRMQSEEYLGKTQLKVTWIDSKDASAERQLKVLDSSAVKNLTAKLKAGGLGGIKKTTPAKPATPAKPTKPGGASGAAKPGAAPTPSASAAPSAAGPSSTTAAVAAPAAGTTAPTSSTPVSEPAKSAPKPPKAGKKSTPPPPPAPVAADPDTSVGLPAESSQGDAWEYLCNNKGANDDSAIEDAWIAACGEVGDGKTEDQFTPADWAKVRNTVIKDLAL